MAPIPRAKSPVVENTDPVLVKLAETATFDVPWEDLRHSLYLGLVGALPLFIEKGPPVQYTGLIMIEPAPSPTSGPDWAEREMRMREEHPELRPSTHGGLVIPPFPPLDTERRRRPSRLNGTPRSPFEDGKNPFDESKNPFEDDWDEETIIGGRKLPGWYDAEEGKKEVDRVAKRLEALTFPPFTIQRLAELLLAPTRLHSTLGKFLRAVEKLLSVSTAYSPPSYTYVPPPTLPLDDSEEMITIPRDTSSTVPPGSMTPLFSPIPFLSSHDMDGLDESLMDAGEGGVEDGLMSPLALESGVFSHQQGPRRSPTPEPGEDVEMGDEANPDHPDPEEPSRPSAPEPTEAASAPANGESENPGHAPYMGRVDELDAGPITSNGHSNEDEVRGVGERGDMAPHGMSERPVPITATTVITEEEREIAPLPARAEAEAKSETEGAPDDTPADAPADDSAESAGEPDASKSEAATSGEAETGTSEGTSGDVKDVKEVEGPKEAEEPEGAKEEGPSQAMEGITESKAEETQPGSEGEEAKVDKVDAEGAPAA